MNLSRFHPRHFWSSERGLTGLLWFISIYLLVVCALSDFGFGDLVADLLFSFIIVAGVMTTFRQRWVGSLAIILAAVSLALTWEQTIYPGVNLTILNTVLRVIFLSLLLAVLFEQVFRAGPVTLHRVRGAIVVYLLLGGLWSLLYQIVALTIPHAFHFSEGLAAGDLNALQRILTYFSYTTLTTTGFGDITPLHPVARTLAMFEAVVGQLYLVITLARLVSLAILGSKVTAPNPSKE